MENILNLQRQQLTMFPFTALLDTVPPLSLSLWTLFPPNHSGGPQYTTQKARLVLPPQPPRAMLFIPPHHAMKKSLGFALWQQP